MAADGSVIIEAKIDDKQTVKVLAGLKSHLKSLEKDFANTGKQKSGLEEKLQNVNAEFDKTIAKMDELHAKFRESKKWTDAREKNSGLDSTQLSGANALVAGKYAEQASLQKQIDELLPKQEKLKQKASEYEGAIKKATEAYRYQLNAINDIKSRIGKIEGAQVAQANEAMKTLKEGAGNAGEAATQAIPSFGKLFKGVMKWGLGIRSLFIIVRKLKQAVIEYYKDLAKTDTETQKNLVGLKSSLAELKGAFGSAFAPIINAIVPYLKEFIQWLTKAMNSVARFTAVLAGKTSYKKAVANTRAIQAGISGVADAAAEANTELMGFDELNVLSDTTGNTGTGSEYELIEEAIDGNSIIARAALNLKDFFDWDNTEDAESIPKKIIGILGAACGGAIGFEIGGIRGAFVGATVGLIASSFISALLFNNDGKMSKQELSDMLITALGALAGGIIGFTLGGPAGTKIGMIIGAGLTLAIKKINWEDTALYKYFKERIDAWAAYGKGETGWIGFSIVAGILEGIFDALINIGQWIYEHIFKPIYDGICDAFDIHSPSKVMEEVGKNIIQGLIDGALERWNNLTTTLHNKWDALKHWWEGLSLGAFDFKLPHINVSWDEVSNSIARFLGVTALPRLSVQWYARGGIVNGTTLIGAGEAGREAIIPLERHTEWIKMVADGIADILIDRFAGAMPAFPAMAGGTIIPPKMEYALGRGDTDGNSRIYTLLQNIADRIDALENRPINLNSPVYIDKRKIGEAVTQYQRESARSRG